MVAEPEPRVAGSAAIAKPPLLKIYTVQALILLVAVIALMPLDSTLALSTLLGGLTALGPNAYFAHYAFRYQGAQAARQVANAFYRGEAGKFMISACLFAVIFSAVRPLHVGALFTAFIVMTGLNAGFAVRMMKRQKS